MNKSSDDWNKLKHLVDLSAENARLKAEVDNSNRINTELLLLSNKQASEVRRLTAELSNISGWGRGLESDLSHARVEISFLKAEVKRLSAADSYLQDANEHAFEKRCDELEAEVERLTQELKDEKSANANVEGRQQSANRNLGMENARLKAEVERLTNCKSEADRLKSEVERLRNLGIKLDGYVDLLQAENERLRKAGDALFGIAYNAGPGEGRVEKLDAWRAAKEGNQP